MFVLLFFVVVVVGQFITVIMNTIPSVCDTLVIRTLGGLARLKYIYKYFWKYLYQKKTLLRPILTNVLNHIQCIVYNVYKTLKVKKDE